MESRLEPVLEPIPDVRVCGADVMYKYWKNCEIGVVLFCSILAINTELEPEPQPDIGKCCTAGCQ